MQSNNSMEPARMSIQLTYLSEDGNTPRYLPRPSQHPQVYADRLNFRLSRVLCGHPLNSASSAARFHGGSPLCEDLIPLPPSNAPHISQGENTQGGVDAKIAVPRTNGDQQAMIAQKPPHAPNSHNSEAPFPGNLSPQPVLSPHLQTRSVSSSVTLAESIDYSTRNTAGQEGSSHWTGVALREWQNSSAVHEITASDTCSIHDKGKGKEVRDIQHNSAILTSQATSSSPSNSEDNVISAKLPSPNPNPFLGTRNGNNGSVAKEGLNAFPSANNTSSEGGQSYNIPRYNPGYRHTSNYGIPAPYRYTPLPPRTNNTYVPEYSSFNMFTGKRFNPNPTQGVKRSYEDHKDQDGPKDIEQHERAAKQAKSQASSGPMNTTSKLPPQRPDSPPQHPYVLYQWDGSGYDFVAHKKFYPAAYYKYHANDNNDANHNEAGDKSGAQQSSPAAEKKTETEVYDMDSPGANCLLKLDAPASPAPANADAVVEEYDVEEYDAEEYDVEEYDVEEYDVEEYDVEEHDVVDVADVPGSDVDVLTELEGPDIAEEPVREQIANGAAYDEEDKENQDVVDDGDAENYYEDDSDDGECDMSSCLVCGI